MVKKQFIRPASEQCCVPRTSWSLRQGGGGDASSKKVSPNQQGSHHRPPGYKAPFEFNGRAESCCPSTRSCRRLAPRTRHSAPNIRCLHGFPGGQAALSRTTQRDARQRYRYRACRPVVKTEVQRTAGRVTWPRAMPRPADWRVQGKWVLRARCRPLTPRGPSRPLQCTDI